jgi:hypothetical protein
LLAPFVSANSITGTTGAVVQISAPSSTALNIAGQPESYVFAEQQGVSVTGLAVDLLAGTGDGTLGNSGTGTSGSITGLVDSWYVVNQSGPNAPNSEDHASTITFNSAVLGVEVTDPGLDLSDFLGAPGTTYPTGIRGFELSSTEFITISGDTVTWDDQTSTEQDDIRIITADAPSVPEPGTLSLLATGVAGFFVRRRQKK